MFSTKKILFLIVFTSIFSFSFSREDTVVLASNFQQLFGGSNWDPANHSTTMTTKDGILYEVSLDLPKGKYEYKVAINNTWDENYGDFSKGSNENIVFSTESTTNITFLFNSISKLTNHRFNYVVPSDEKTNALTNIGDYMDISDSETLFLFKTHNNAKVSFYLGELGKELKLIFNNQTFGNKEFVVDKLIPGKKYQYKVTSTYMNEKIQSDIFTFTKSEVKSVKSSPKWPKSAVIYEIFPRSFYDNSGDGIGDFKGLKKKIPYFKELGINTLWLTPILPSPSSHGYDLTDYKSINKDFGNLEDFKEFLSDAKKNDIKIILEMVFNHTSTEHPWFKEALKDKKSPYREYYFFENNFAKSANFPRWHNKDENIYLGTYTESMADLNVANPNVRKELKDAIKFWIDLGVDGFRFPNYNYIDESLYVNDLWWKELSSYVKNINKDIFLIGQNADFDIGLSNLVLKNMDAVNDYNMPLYLYKSMINGNFDFLRLLNIVDSLYKKTNPNYVNLAFLSNHDNERLASIFNGDINKQKFALSVLLTLPYTPILYYGDEIGQLGEGDDKYIREAMDWYTDSNNNGMAYKSIQKYTKSDDGISVEEQRLKEDSMLNFTKKLLQIRKNYSVFKNGKLEELLYSNGVKIFQLSNESEKLIIIYNNSDSTFTIPNEVNNINLEPFSTAIIKGDEILFNE